MNIAIVGGGWYGCYIAEYILNSYSNINITIYEQHSNIFCGSSYYNQNRLHLGFHYPRSQITMDKCKIYFNRFLEKYNNYVRSIDKNIYAIAKNSMVPFNEFTRLFSKDDYIIESDNYLSNIEGMPINTREMYIDFKKIQNHFLDLFKKYNKRVILKLNTNVSSIENTEDSRVVINNDTIYNRVFNCTYNQLLSNDTGVVYEKCITLIFKKTEKTPFDCLTIMDGLYSSIFIYDLEKSLYTLTDVEFTPIIKDISFNIVNSYTLNNIDLDIIKDKFISKVKLYYPEFSDKFIYDHYYLSIKCKNINSDDSRDINISINNNIFSVWCGKISLVVELDSYIERFINKALV